MHVTVISEVLNVTNGVYLQVGCPWLGCRQAMEWLRLPSDQEDQFCLLHILFRTGGIVL
jgi:hypothetical protein